MSVFRKVRTGTRYRYDPVPLDVIDARTSLEPGTIVQVIRPYGCPAPGTMGHCHIGDADTGRFIGLVCVNSLKPIE